uniref:Kinesin motor domain-containing protein n=1 Tax=Timema poppense TaxID=170557 RepID=A0A7R9CFQ1_TIMPO|nr:unnamed protein product [Timema poppensis]
MASLVLTDSSQLTTDGFEKVPDQIIGSLEKSEGARGRTQTWRVFLASVAGTASPRNFRALAPKHERRTTPTYGKLLDCNVYQMARSRSNESFVSSRGEVKIMKPPAGITHVPLGALPAAPAHYTFALDIPSDSHLPQDYEIFCDGKDEDELLIPYKNQDNFICNKNESHLFRFCKLFDQYVDQKDVFENVAKPVLESVLKGYNGTVFAYGQTGSGKTFTITGGTNEYEKRGVIPRAIQHIFQAIQSSQESLYTLYVSYLEIYNECGYDLLNPKHDMARLEDLPRVTLLEDTKGNLHLRHLNVHSVRSEEEALNLLFLGDTNRTIAETPMNLASSRSHCIFTLHVIANSTKSSKVRSSKMHFVDLAGSERVHKSGLAGKTLTEARNINLSLHFLEQVIIALGDIRRHHIPYRNSMMTSVLRDSLGGNCLTAMIATLSLDRRNIEETLATCRFAQRVALVSNEASPNEERDPLQEITLLKAEIQRLSSQLALHTNEQLTEELSEGEVNECRDLVSKFLTDSPRASTIPVPPDLRKIQLCFKLLRDRNVPPPGVVREGKSGDVEKYVELVRQRDVEISVLISLLKKEKKRTLAAVSECNQLRNTAQASSSVIALETPTDLDATPGAALTEVTESCGDGSFLCARLGKPLSTAEKEALKIFASDSKNNVEVNTYRMTLKTKYKDAKEVAGKIETIREKIVNLRSILENPTSKSSRSSLTDPTFTHEEFLQHIRTKLEKEQSCYKTQLVTLQNLKTETDHIKHGLEQAKIRYFNRFQDWWKTQEGFTMTTGNVSSSILPNVEKIIHNGDKINNRDKFLETFGSNFKTVSGNVNYIAPLPDIVGINGKDVQTYSIPKTDSIINTEHKYVNAFIKPQNLQNDDKKQINLKIKNSEVCLQYQNQGKETSLYSNERDEPTINSLSRKYVSNHRFSEHNQNNVSALRKYSKVSLASSLDCNFKPEVKQKTSLKSLDLIDPKLETAHENLPESNIGQIAFENSQENTSSHETPSIQRDKRRYDNDINYIRDDVRYSTISVEETDDVTPRYPVHSMTHIGESFDSNGSENTSENHKQYFVLPTHIIGYAKEGEMECDHYVSGKTSRCGFAHEPFPNPSSVFSKQTKCDITTIQTLGDTYEPTESSTEYGNTSSCSASWEDFKENMNLANKDLVQDNKRNSSVGCDSNNGKRRTKQVLEYSEDDFYQNHQDRCVIPNIDLKGDCVYSPDTRCPPIEQNTDKHESFIDSLPLTGDPEVDEEIIAFYRARIYSAWQRWNTLSSLVISKNEVNILPDFGNITTLKTSGSTIITGHESGKIAMWDFDATLRSSLHWGPQQGRINVMEVMCLSVLSEDQFSLWCIHRNYSPEDIKAEQGGIIRNQQSTILATVSLWGGVVSALSATMNFCMLSSATRKFQSEVLPEGDAFESASIVRAYLWQNSVSVSLTGQLHLFSLQQIEDLLCLNVNKPSLSLNVCGDVIAEININETLLGPIITVCSSKKVYCIELSKEL